MGYDHAKIGQHPGSQGSHVTSTEVIKALAAREIKISIDGKGAWRDNVFVERLWRVIKELCLISGDAAYYAALVLPGSVLASPSVNLTPSRRRGY